MPTVWAGLPSDTWWTKTPVLLPPTTASWLSSASPWKEMLSTRPLTRMAFWRERIKKGGAAVFDRLVREEIWLLQFLFFTMNISLYLGRYIFSKRRKRSRPLKSETRCESSTCLQFKDVYSCMRCSRCIRLSLLFSWITTSLEWKITVYIGWIAMKFCKNWHQLITKLVVIFLLVPSIVQDFNFVKKLKLTV